MKYTNFKLIQIEHVDMKNFINTLKKKVGLSSKPRKGENEAA